MNSKTPAAKTATVPTPPLKVPPLFRRIDWWTLGITFAIVWLVYFITLAPQVGLEDSGELTTASYWAGIPHPPGYPFWTIYTWLWTVLVPFGNIAWRVQLAEASTAAMACAVLAFMVSRGSSMLMEGIEELKGMTGKWENGICVVSGITAGLLMAFGTNLWKESVIINRISPFGVPWLMLVLLSMMRWIYAPHQRRYLYLAMFFLGICITIHQTLMLGILGIEIGICLAYPPLGRDLLFVNAAAWMVGRIAIGAHLMPQMESANFMIRAIFDAVGICSLIGCIVLIIKTARLLTEWKALAPMLLLGLAGASFYFYEPLAGMTNPPMEWGYPRTVAGFFEALSRGQYNRVEPTDIIHDFGRFTTELGMLVNGVADAFNWVYMFFALLPLAFILKMKKRERAWVGLIVAIYPFLGVLLSICLSPTRDRQSADLVKVFFIASHALVAIMIGYGLALTAAYMSTHYTQFRKWGLLGAIAVALPLALFNFKSVAGEHYFGLDGVISWSDLPHYMMQAFAKDQYGLPIFANLILVGSVLIFIIALTVYRERAPLLITMCLFAAMPLYSGLTHWFHSEQRDHYFGYWFGHDMFTPPFVGKSGDITYDPAQREAAAKATGPEAKMVYPEMARDAVLFGGTDPGRFCPTYMIFSESFIPHRCQPEQDTNFDRRDVYIITQNALADPVYLDYIRAQFNRRAQIDPPFFQDLLPGALPSVFHDSIKAFKFLDDIFSSIGAHIEFRRRAGSSFFEPDQFTNIKDLTAKLHAQQDNVSKFLFGKLRPETQALLSNPTDESALRHNLAKDLNVILADGSIYDSNRFINVKVPPLIAQAESTSNIPATTIRLNRRLLEETYKGDIAMSLGGVYPDTEILTPSPADSKKCLDDYYGDVARRAQHDMSFPNEPKQLRGGEEVKEVGGKWQISGGQGTVMGINGLLTKVIFDKNPGHEFYVEESFPLEWMYPYLTPFSVIMKINREPVAELSQEVLDKDHAFWSQFSRRTTGNWINYDTSVSNICDWAEDVYLHHNFAHFNGDRKFIRDEDAQKAFSKMRCAIGQSIYMWRVRNPHNGAEQARVLKEAEFALKQGFAYCAYSTEAVYDLMNLLLTQGRVHEAIRILHTAHKLDPFNGQFNDWTTQLERNDTGGGGATGGQSPDVHRFFSQVQQALDAKQTNAAIGMLDQLLHYGNTDPNTMASVGVTYLNLGDIAKTEEAFTRVVQMVPNSSQGWFNLAIVQAQRQETQKSVDSLKKAIENNPAERKQNPEVPDLNQMMRSDSGLANLRNTPEFKAAFP